ncbi:hypothetical protein [Pseudoponticoccus marisrubri]|uniref:Uncharacterized protein n=1 Tax=Pseudoponticoccus marisrubri TaxID=1685382 RepID=A0A0W7WJ26_9RHOB|nr:hypothetical protein [Pseudoponticoccus marisrubri]KUF10516.1 hypothetical protein AVJ23_11590 [Pseudoponticoccus marisrubri]
MATYKAVLMHGERGGEGRYSFEAEDGVLERSTHATMTAFMQHLQGKLEPAHMDWRLDGVLRNDDLGVITAAGTLIFDAGDRQPFVCMINEA